ncbi:MAG: putative endonuclease [Proteobacteria bacterium]|nr:putative endonuclease [Pseudomonadota bacterium]
MGNWVGKIRKVLDCVLPGGMPQASQGKATEGARAERLAEQHLTARGVKILARNVRCKGGEIDLIALYEGCVLFIEVRLRKRSDFGGAASSITRAKQRRIVLTAQHWLQGPGRAFRGHPCRFDAITFNALDRDHIEWLPSAFSAEKA